MCKKRGLKKKKKKTNLNVVNLRVKRLIYKLCCASVALISGGVESEMSWEWPDLGD